MNGALLEAAATAHTASAIESLLLVAAEPLTIRGLCRLLDADGRTVEAALSQLSTSLENHGIRLERDGDRVQLVTAPENAELVRELLRLPRQARVSPASLETLAVVAYRQPVTRPEVEHIRGVSSDRVLANLMARGLIEERGQRQTPGRPMQFGTTDAFLQLFGLISIEELPPPGSEAEPGRASLHVLGLRSVRVEEQAASGTRE